MFLLPETGGDNSNDTGGLLNKISAVVDHVVRVITVMGFLVGVVIIAENNPYNLAVNSVKWALLIPTVVLYLFFLVQHIARVSVEITKLQNKKIANLIVRFSLGAYLVFIVSFGGDLLKYIAQIKLFQ